MQTIEQRKSIGSNDFCYICILVWVDLLSKAKGLNAFYVLVIHPWPALYVLYFLS